MSDDPFKEIRKAEDVKRKAVQKRDEQRNAAIKKAKDETDKNTAVAREKMIEKVKQELAQIRQQESEKLKKNLAKEQQKIETYITKIQSEGRIESAVKSVVDVFLKTV